MVILMMSWRISFVYVTNHTGADLPLQMQYQSDDSHIFMIDNTAYSFYKGCCGYDDGRATLPPGEHRPGLQGV